MGQKKVTFLGWSQPLLPHVAEILASRCMSERLLDLSDSIIVFPGAQAGRRFLELLTLEAAKVGAILFPPQVITPGGLFNAIIPELPLPVPQTTRLLAWVEALQRIPDETREALAFSVRDQDNFSAWFGLARRIESLYRELLGEDVFFVEVAERADALESFNDEVRWSALAELEQQFYAILKAHNLRDELSARIEAIRGQAPRTLVKKVYLIGVLDMNRTQHHLLETLETDVESFVFAPQQYEQFFDSIGVLLTKERELFEEIVPDRSIVLLDRPSDATAFIVSECQNQPNKKFTIGIGNEDEAGYLVGTLEAHGLKIRRAEGQVFSATVLGSALSLLQRYLMSSSFYDGARLLSHPMLENIIRQEAGAALPESCTLASIADEYQDTHFQARFSRTGPLNNEKDALYHTIVRVIEKLTEDFSEIKRTCPEWVSSIEVLLLRLQTYVVNGEEDLVEAVLNILPSLHQYAVGTPLSGGEVLKLTLSALDGLITIPDDKDSTVEARGWLELALDDTPNLFLIGLDEGSVPAVVNSDPFLPNSLRSTLGLIDNERRMRRDRFLLEAMLNSREQCRVLVVRRHVEGDERFPSKLLVAAPRERVAERLMSLHGSGSRYVFDYQSVRSDTLMPVLSEPRPDIDPVDTMSVTSFRDYLECPYRFFLKHILDVKTYQGIQHELDAKTFGTLVHAVCEEFAQNPEASSNSSPRIFEVLRSVLQSHFEYRFGDHGHPTIDLQYYHLLERFAVLADWQAEQVNNGWKVLHSEHTIDAKLVRLEGEWGSVGLSGRIDRIDYNRALNRYRIIDFKSANNAVNAQRIFHQDTWIDLQMPLYGFALRELTKESDVEYVYMNLSADVTSDPVYSLSISSQQMTEALEIANAVAAKVRAGIFWPPQILSNQDPYAWILPDRGDEDDEIEGSEEVR
jgi:hypothetical protein